jgi:transposase
MKKREFAGIDVSKSTLDVCLFDKKSHNQFENNEKGFKKLTKWIEKATGKRLNEMEFCFEHTGLYSLPLSIYLEQNKTCFYVVSGLLVKRSLGLKRGKSDKIDAFDLARFAYLHRGELKPYKLPPQSIIKLKQLQSFRARLVKQCATYKAHIKEVRLILGYDNKDPIINTSVELIKVFTEKIKVIEREMMQYVKADEELNQTYKNVTTIKGVGMIVAIAVLTSTNNFQSFDNWRQFACYAGIAPFEHQSGISYRGKTRISTLGNRQLKTLLSQAAASSIQFNPEMRVYYQRRLSEGKNKMSTLNIIRNKIVSRIFAVAKRNTPYVDIYKYAA